MELAKNNFKCSKSGSCFHTLKIISMKGILLLLFASLLFTTDITAQDWRKLSKMADKHFQLAQYDKAATYYEKAWKDKDTKKELLYKAAECYQLMHDYRKAADVYSQLRKDHSLFPLVDWKYARMLMSDGQYKEAKEVLRTFQSKYEGSDKQKILTLVANDLSGCEKGLNAAEELEKTNILLENPGENINTVASEFAPVPFSDDILYFSSDMKANKSRIYRSQRIAGAWTPAVEPSLPNIPEGHLSNGTFTPNGKRFYFTICNSNKAWDGMQSECDIYVTRRAGNDWASPVKLRDYIRMEGSTATHPYVAHIEGKEILYYVTDRVGGKGGLDIWYTTREISSDDYDFTLPQNAGANINTPGDETTPFYDVSEGVLYFSSNGHPSIGGLDIFKASGAEENFEEAKSLGVPYNSSAEDYYFRKNLTGTGGFLVSNRLFGLEKIETTQEDIFTFSNPMDIPIVKGKVIDKAADQNLQEVRVALFELKGVNNKRLLTSQTFSSGNYEFGLLPNKKYRIQASKAGFTPASIDFDTYGYEDKKGYEFPLALSPGNSALVKTDAQAVFKKSDAVASSDKRFQSSTKTKPQATTRSSSNDSKRPPSQTTTTENQTIISHPSTPKTTPYRQATAPQNNRTTPLSEAPKHQGTYYKVQFTVLVDYRSSDPLLDNARDLGRFDTELIVEKGWTRVLVAEFFDMGEAIRIANKLQKRGYPDAFVVKYRNGRRVSL